MLAEFGHTPKVTISDHQRDEYLQFACSAVRAAGRVILPHFRSGVPVTNKVDNGGFDPVTLADQAGERAIREAIELDYPEHGIFGEELGDCWFEGELARFEIATKLLRVSSAH